MVSMRNKKKIILQLSLNTPSYLELWAWLFKTNDVVSLKDVKISNVNILNLPIFFVEKM